MNVYVRQAKLTSVVGRADYISNPERQEYLVETSLPQNDMKEFFKPYRDYERNNRKSADANNEGREVVVALPNDYANLSQEQLRERCQSVAEKAVGKSEDMQWAVHWNKSKTNLHLHVIFSERSRTDAVGVWDRDIWLDAFGKVARNKADRVELKHKKGDEKEGFTVKDKWYSGNWRFEVKDIVTVELERQGVEVNKEIKPFKEYHEGKGSDAPTIRLKNECVRASNEIFYQNLQRSGSEDNPKPLIKKMLSAIKELLILFVYPDGSRNELTLEEWRRSQELTVKTSERAREGEKASKGADIPPTAETSLKTQNTAIKHGASDEFIDELRGDDKGLLDFLDDLGTSSSKDTSIDTVIDKKSR